MFETSDGGRSWHVVPTGEVRFEQVVVLPGGNGWAMARDALYRLTAVQLSGL